jgi:type I restriction enzyme S subunit
MRYFCQSRLYWDHITSSQAGSTLKNISLPVLRSLNVPLPSSIEEQQKIAEILSTVDEAIQKANEIIAKTERLKKGLMQELLTKGIGHKEFKDTEIGRIPKEWEVVKLGDVVTYRKGIKPKVVFDHREPNTLPYLTADDVRAGIFTKWAKESDKIIKVNKDDVILIWDGFYCGDAFIGLEGILSSTMIKIEPKSNLNGRFLFYILKTHFKELNTKISGMYLKHVNKSVFENLKLPLPPPQEQQKIMEILSRVDKKLEIEKNQKAKLERIKQGLMDLLLTGKVRVKVN